MRIQLHTQGAHLGADQLRLQPGCGDVALAELLVVVDSEKQEEAGPEDDQIADQLGGEMEVQSLPVRHGRMAERKAREARDPDHLFADAEDQAHRDEDREHGTQVDVLDRWAKDPPQEPEQTAEQKILHAPGFEQQDEADGTVPEARVEPVLKRKEAAQHHGGRDEDGRMHEERLS